MPPYQNLHAVQLSLLAHPSASRGCGPRRLSRQRAGRPCRTVSGAGLARIRGLTSWTFIGIAWLVHTAADVVHHVKGDPIIPFAEHSSLGCAVCDPVIAL